MHNYIFLCVVPTNLIYKTFIFSMYLLVFLTSYSCNTQIINFIKELVSSKQKLMRTHMQCHIYIISELFELNIFVYSFNLKCSVLF